MIYGCFSAVFILGIVIGWFLHGMTDGKYIEGYQRGLIDGASGKLQEHRS